MIASMFSSALDTILQEKITDLQNLQTLALSLGNKEEAEDYKKQIKQIGRADILTEVGPVGIFNKIKLESIDSFLQLSDNEKLEVVKSDIIKEVMDSLDEN